MNSLTELSPEILSYGAGKSNAQGMWRRGNLCLNLVLVA